jgi:plasmid stabilization system protein ParE
MVNRSRTGSAPCMKYDLIIRSQAEVELAEAYDWYEDRVQGLGSEFLLAVDAVLQSVARNPRQYPVVYKKIHRALTRRFPYAVFFLVDRKQVVVLAVFHASRNPDAWQRRAE